LISEIMHEGREIVDDPTIHSPPIFIRDLLLFMNGLYLDL